MDVGDHPPNALWRHDQFPVDMNRWNQPLQVNTVTSTTPAHYARDRGNGPPVVMVSLPSDNGQPNMCVPLSLVAIEGIETIPLPRAGELSALAPFAQADILMEWAAWHQQVAGLLEVYETTYTEQDENGVLTWYCTLREPAVG